MALVEIEKNDIIATKDGRSFRVLSVYKNGNDLYKVEGIDDNEPTPMRRPIFNHEIARVVRKALKSAGTVALEKAQMPAGGDVGVKIPKVEKPADDASFETKKGDK